MDFGEHRSRPQAAPRRTDFTDMAREFLDRWLALIDGAVAKHRVVEAFFAGLGVVRAGASRAEWLAIRDLCDRHPVSDRIYEVLTEARRIRPEARAAFDRLERRRDTLLH